MFSMLINLLLLLLAPPRVTLESQCETQLKTNRCHARHTRPLPSHCPLAPDAAFLKKTMYLCALSRSTPTPSRTRAPPLRPRDTHRSFFRCHVLSHGYMLLWGIGRKTSRGRGREMIGHELADFD